MERKSHTNKIWTHKGPTGIILRISAATFTCTYSYALGSAFIDSPTTSEKHYNRQNESMTTTEMKP